MSIISKKTKTRGVWNIKPVVRVVESKKVYNRKKIKSDEKRSGY